MFTSHTEYKEADEECLSALNDTINDTDWIKKYEYVYANIYSGCAIQPEGRPVIFLTQHDGIEYFNIDKFQLLYRRKKYPHEFKNYEEEILQLMEQYTNQITKEDVQKVNIKCIKAIGDQIPLTNWLEKYADLFNTCTIKPKDSIPLAMSFYEDSFFKGIDDFVCIYNQRNENISQ
jgi:hypothetical protein